MPAETISALGSAARIIGATVVSIWAYPLALGVPPHQLGKLGSFQICQAVIGSLGTLGLFFQKLPLGP